MEHTTVNPGWGRPAARTRQSRPSPAGATHPHSSPLQSPAAAPAEQQAGGEHAVTKAWARPSAHCPRRGKGARARVHGVGGWVGEWGLGLGWGWGWGSEVRPGRSKARPLPPGRPAGRVRRCDHSGPPGASLPAGVGSGRRTPAGRCTGRRPAPARPAGCAAAGLQAHRGLSQACNILVCTKGALAARILDT